MAPDDVLAHPPRILTQAEREYYFTHGYVLAGKIVPDAWLERLKAALADLIHRSRALAQSDRSFDLETEHTAASPRLRRVTNTNEAHPTFWQYISESLIADVAADLVGPDVKFMDSNLNFKWARGGTEIKWHQDAQYSPHTDYRQVTIATMLEDVGLEQAPMGVVPGSHEGELFNLYGQDGVWTGAICDRDLERVALDSVVHLMGPAGTVHAHNCRTIHGSARNESTR